MPNSRKLSKEDYSKFDFMTTEELQQILHDDFEKADEESDIDMILYVSGLLAARRKPGELEKTAAESWESFKKNYYPEFDQAVNDEPPEEVPHKKRKGGMPWWTRAVAAAAMFALIMGSAITAKAFGFDLWDIIVKWTQETFHIGYYGDANVSGPQQDDTIPYLGLREALDALNITVPLAPTWLPDGFAEDDIRIQEDPNQRRIIASYRCENSSIVIRIADHTSDNPLQIEQSGEEMEIYSAHGVDYYILSNYEQLRIVWINQNYECSIIGPISISDAKKMIDSIGGT